MIKIDRELVKPNSLADILHEDDNEYSKRDIAGTFKDFLL